MVRHLQMWDYVSLSASKDGKWVEFVDQQHEHFIDPAIVKNACYVVPKLAGYSTEFKAEAVLQHQYPVGSVWQKLLK